MAFFDRQTSIGYWFGAVALLASAGAVGALAAESDAVPRYKLSVGQELVYRAGKTTVTFYVTGSNPDGGWHVFELYRAPGPTAGTDSNGGKDLAFLECEFDIRADGSIALKQAAGFHPRALLPALPPGPSTTDWQANGPQEEELHYHLQPSTQPSVRVLAVDIDGPLLRSQHLRATGRIVFDIALGLPVRFENRSEFIATHKERTGLSELIENKIHPAGWADQTAQEAAAVLQAQSRYQDEMHLASEATDDARYLTLCNAALAHLQEVRSGLTVRDFVEAIDTDVYLHPRQVFFGRGPEALLGQPAPSWRFPDLQGNQHALADYRGKVVVLDFWYRTCLYCILEMPHLKNVAARYAGKPVVFLGMNVDRDPKDAQAMVTQQGLTFPTLITKGLARSEDPTSRPAAGPAMLTAYHIKGYPSVLVIGPDGIIRQVMGSSDAFEENLAKAIDPLLPPDH